jgi:hypothetical protein
MLEKQLKTSVGDGNAAAKLHTSLRVVKARLGILLDSTSGYYRSLLHQLIQRYIGGGGVFLFCFMSSGFTRRWCQIPRSLDCPGSNRDIQQHILVDVIRVRTC